MSALLITALLFAAFVVWHVVRHHGRDHALVVYCAHDAIFSERILKRFEQETGIPIAVRFDTEATKSLGLVDLIIREKEAPRCDVFWNNELLGMFDLQEKGVLSPTRVKVSGDPLIFQGRGWPLDRVCCATPCFYS